MYPSITFSESAKDYIKKMIEKNQGLGFRLTIKKTGCSGYSYSPSVITEAHPKDVCIEMNGVTLFIDPAWIDVFQGLHIDYGEEVKAGLKQKKLKFSNPNEGDRCGCGESFHIEG